MGLLNMGSLLLGLIAWILPVANLAIHNKVEHKDWITFLFASISSCVISLFFQIVYQNHLAKKEDWSAISDTSGGLVFVSAMLIVVTITLNLITLVKYLKINGNKQS